MVLNTLLKENSLKFQRTKSVCFVAPCTKCEGQSDEESTLQGTPLTTVIILSNGRHQNPLPNACLRLGSSIEVRVFSLFKCFVPFNAQKKNGIHLQFCFCLIRS